MARCLERKTESYSEGIKVVDRHFDYCSGWLPWQSLQSNRMWIEAWVASVIGHYNSVFYCGGGVPQVRGPALLPGKADAYLSLEQE